MTSSLIRSLDQHARLRPDAVAVREIGESGIERSLTWRELRDASFLVGLRLRRLSGGSVVMISSSNSVELLASILGGLWAGVAVLPVSPELPGAELRELVQRSSVAALVGGPAALDLLSAEVPKAISLGSLPLGQRTHPAGGELGGSGSILLHSSGTTGMPKIVRRGAAALDAVGENCRRAIDVRESDTMLLAIPLYHSYGIDLGVLTAVTAGCSIELHRHFDLAIVKTALLERGVTILPAVPLMFDALARAAKPGAATTKLRRAFSAGSPLPRRVFDRFEEIYAIKVGQIYGATEFGSVTFNDPEGEHFDPEQVGLPLNGVQLRIVDRDEPQIDRPLPVGEEGQVAVSSPSMLTEYVDDPASPTTGGFLLTGDLGRLDHRGRLTLTGRTKLMIDVGGLKVNPLEVEAVLTRHPDVREAVAVAVPYSDTSCRLKAIIIPEPGSEVSVDELREFARRHLIHYKVPRSFEIRTTVPRSPTGKILRQQL